MATMSNVPYLSWDMMSIGSDRLLDLLKRLFWGLKNRF